MLNLPASVPLKLILNGVSVSSSVIVSETINALDVA